jgi:hypothetical protein
MENLMSTDGNHHTTSMHESSRAAITIPTARRNAVDDSAWTPHFVLTIDQMRDLAQTKQQFFEQVMKRDLHYGSLGNNAKPTLLKPGAELLLSSMGLYAELVDAEFPIRNYDSGPDSEAIILYRRDCLVYRQEGAARILVARAEGTCSTRETQYRYREMKRSCPICKSASIIKGKEEYGGGWVCWIKRGGCDAKFQTGDASIEIQRVGREINPDIADLENTIEKIADKRALVAATLLATGCSDLFTQDMEDAVVPANAENGPEATASAHNDPAAPSPTVTVPTVDHIKETIAIFQCRNMPRTVFGEMVLRHLGVPEIKTDSRFTQQQVAALRSDVITWSPLTDRPRSPEPITHPTCFDAAAFAKAIPDDKERDVYLEQIDPDAVTIADLTPSQCEELRLLIHGRLAA